MTNGLLFILPQPVAFERACPNGHGIPAIECFSF